MNLDPAILDLIIERATCGLSTDDQNRLDQLILSSEDPRAIFKEIEKFELSVAALELSQIQEISSTPTSSQNPFLSPALQAKIRRQSTEVVADPAFSDDLAHDLTKLADYSTTAVRINRRPALKDILIWTVAAASLLALALFIRQSPDGDQVVTEKPTINELEPSIDLVDDVMPTDEQMKKFLGSTPEDLLTLSWTPVDNKNVTGEVFWSDQRQEGFMTFNGLEINDPRQKQYQVWIYDTDAQEQRPVNGGVFDVSKTGRYIVPIAPLSPVKKAVQFAITAEQPGGVEVSDRNHVPTVASKPF